MSARTDRWGSIEAAATDLGFAVIPMEGTPVHSGRIAGRPYVTTDPRIPRRGLERLVATALGHALVDRLPTRPRNAAAWVERFASRLLVRVQRADLVKAEPHREQLEPLGRRQTARRT